MTQNFSQTPHKDLMGLFDQIKPQQSFDQLSISIASPETIRSWSFGEVKKPETINYRTFKPERDGLFCSRIFGPIKDYECLCGKYKRLKYRGVVCEKCGVEVTLSKVRRERMGHIELASPVAHIWFTKSLPSRIGTLLDLTNKDLERILYFQSYIVIEPGLTALKRHQLLTEDEYFQSKEELGEDSFQALVGAEALREMLRSLDLVKEQEIIREELASTHSEIKRKKLSKRLKLLEAFVHSKTNPDWMILDVVPVIPPELRPLVPLEGGRFATSDLNDLYRRLINRNNRLKRLMELHAPEIIVRNEKRMLQEIVDALFDNGRRGRPIAGANKRPLKSLSDILKGKHGRFRQNLLGKRVDYSGRSVIVVGPELKLHQCGLPKKMALELFKPFIYSRLERYGLTPTIKSAKRMLEKERPEVWDILEEVIREHPVLLNRAPTLHRLGIQAFEPVLVEGKAIQLHPLVCTAFNADFDGDQMAVHVPLAIEAQIEARVLMMSTNNILNPADGNPIVVPSKDIILGLYYLTMVRETEKGQGHAFASLGDIEHALHVGAVSLHARIITRVETITATGPVFQRVETTPGRMILGAILPKNLHVPFDVINRVLSSKEVGELTNLVYRYCGQKEAVIFSDQLTAVGFKYATLSGASFGKDDLIIPKEKNKFVQDTWALVNEYRQQYLDGLITQGERYNKVTDAWTQCAEGVATVMMEKISEVFPGKPINPIYMMAHSGARGSATQMRQLAAMRGLIAKSSGEIIENPIISNFKEGLSVLEYFTSTHGARKGLSDTALKTANSGYLTRRLVDVAQDCIITEHDCGAQQGFTVRPVIEAGEVLAPLSRRIVGRVCLHDIVDPRSGTVLATKGTLINKDDGEIIQRAGVDEVMIRSALSCKTDFGVCATCYGHDLSSGRLVNIGEAVGVIAAQSIGEPGTQLTMRTFHLGGAAQRITEASILEATFQGIVSFCSATSLKDSKGNHVVVNRHAEAVILDVLTKRERARYRVPYGSHLVVQEGEEVKKGQKIAEWDPYTRPIITELEGIVHFVDLKEGVSLREVLDDTTGISKNVVSDWRQASRGSELRPRIVLRKENGEPVTFSNDIEARYFLPVGSIISIANGATVKAGDIIARVPKESSKSRDITGGLPRIAELFEARKPKDIAILSEHNGRVEFGNDYKAKRRIFVVFDEQKEPVEYIIPKGKQIIVQEGDVVRKGDLLVDGSVAPHDILRIMGVEALAQFLIEEIQGVYRLQGVHINDKHIEVIVRQMLQKCEIIDPGATDFLAGDQVNRKDLVTINEGLCEKGHKPATFFPVLQGITKASLQTNSFISAASFQETTRVLTEAAVFGKKDYLLGLKENVISGHLIPAGTGRIVRTYKHYAAVCDEKKIQEDKKNQEALKVSQEMLQAPPQEMDQETTQKTQGDFEKDTSAPQHLEQQSLENSALAPSVVIEKK